MTFRTDQHTDRASTGARPEPAPAAAGARLTVRLAALLSTGLVFLLAVGVTGAALWRARELADAILGLARELKRHIVGLSKAQRRNLRLEALDRQIKDLANRSRELRRGGVINREPERYRRLAEPWRQRPTRPGWSCPVCRCN